MSQYQVGAVIREHSDKEFRDLGVVVWIDATEDRLWYVPFPDTHKIRKLKGGQAGSPTDEANKDKLKERTRYYIQAPVHLPLSMLEQEAEYSAHPHRLPPLLYLTDEELKANEMRHMYFKTRRDLEKSLAIRDRKWSWIEELTKLPTEKLLDSATWLVAVQQVQQQFQLKSYEPVARALRCYWLWGRNRNALLPRFDKCNEIGMPRLTTKRPGRKCKEKPADQQGIVCTPKVRKLLRDGWRKFLVKEKYAIEAAYHLTLKEFFSYAGSEDLIPEHLRPTQAQFVRHGPGQDPALANKRVKRGQHDYDRNGRPLLGTAQDGLVAAGVRCLLDSTHDDASLVSTKSRRTPTATSFSTPVVEGYTDYILGIHIGYERPSQMTALLAVGNAASPKETFARRYGVELEPGEWLALAPANILGDNGDIKGVKGFAGLSMAEVSAEICASLAAERKGPVEAAHKSTATKAAHLMVGSRKGKRVKRGEPDPAKNAAIKFHEHVRQTIHAICYRNNSEPVPHLLTVEMREAGVKPFRGEILKWLIAEGYVKTEAPNFDAIRAHCLPKLSCRVFRSGVLVIDPTSEGRRYLQKLDYTSAELKATGALDDLDGKGFDSTIRLDPNALREAWVEVKDKGLVRVELKKPDPLIDEMTFSDVVRQAEDDRAFTVENKDNETRAKAKLYSSAYETSQNALRERAKEASESAATNVAKGASTDLPRKPAHAKEKKRVATEKELESQRQERLGLGEEDFKDGSSQQEPSTPGKASSSAGGRPRRPRLSGDNWANNLVKQLRQRYVPRQ